jgi:hypothetical protein
MHNDSAVPFFRKWGHRMDQLVILEGEVMNEKLGEASKSPSSSET